MLLASIGEVYIEIKLSSSCLNSHFFVFAVQKRELLKKYIYTSCPIKRVVKYPNTLFKEPPTQLFGALQTHSQNRVESNLCKKTFSRERTNFSLMNMENLNFLGYRKFEPRRYYIPQWRISYLCRQISARRWR